MSFIERIGKNKVGFYCWKLFIINYFRGYEVRNVHNLENKTKLLLYFKFYSTDHCLNNYFPHENN